MRCHHLEYSQYYILCFQVASANATRATSKRLASFVHLQGRGIKNLSEIGGQLSQETGSMQLQLLSMDALTLHEPIGVHL